MRMALELLESFTIDGAVAFTVGSDFLFLSVSEVTHQIQRAEDDCGNKSVNGDFFVLLNRHSIVLEAENVSDLPRLNEVKVISSTGAIGTLDRVANRPVVESDDRGSGVEVLVVPLENDAVLFRVGRNVGDELVDDLGAERKENTHEFVESCLGLIFGVDVVVFDGAVGESTSEARRDDARALEKTKKRLVATLIESREAFEELLEQDFCFGVVLLSDGHQRSDLGVVRHVGRRGSNEVEDVLVDVRLLEAIFRFIPLDELAGNTGRENLVEGLNVAVVLERFELSTREVGSKHNLLF